MQAMSLTSVSLGKFDRHKTIRDISRSNLWSKAIYLRFIFPQNGQLHFEIIQYTMSFNQELLKFTTVALGGILIYLTCDKVLARIGAVNYQNQETTLNTSIDGQDTQRLSRSVTNIRIEFTQTAVVHNILDR